ncbi:hypothetical protein BATDEDRAFT_36766 [Batrachochytrium dendrobatidis JAM81]|uniref:Sugar transporter SWEET1 n=1 Tax=Batrachochytrium dendrobatidis (strain JAM81 / FGSC 10211) TaxID=684364 RepID=F4NY38_BATDJ|nr:uncharacterized protein BATDEDRAFT_36766 [Batrachochytrium dendrobatidis JAM81]EGF81945.1 hypothetical protein BATDEDRAFT_36766 [Batrachochytrium dendrobatidis JAM81]|eukprot:XP_006677490.1 hypothetical protein BATDEDRAFT_36766 [Batrachochytrium dendrobatidis JAM81]
MSTIECSTPNCQLVLHHIIPIIGVFTALWIFIAPFKSVKRLGNSDNLENVNPLPFPMIVANCLGWLVYGLLIQDIYVIIPNIIGYQFGIYYTLMAYRIAAPEFQSRALQILIGSSLLVFIGGVLGFIVLQGNEAGRIVMGLVCVVILAVFYCSPLSDFYNVIKKKDASSIDVYLAAASLVNGSLWTVYGFAIGDTFIWSPNLLGVVLSLVQFVLLAIFARPKSHEFQVLRNAT